MNRLFIPRSPNDGLPLYDGFTHYALPTSLTWLKVVTGSGDTHAIRTETDDEHSTRLNAVTAWHAAHGGSQL